VDKFAYCKAGRNEQSTSVQERHSPVGYGGYHPIPAPL